jgi:hypothetical protein
MLPPAPSLESLTMRGRFDAEAGAYLRADAGLGLMRARSAASTFGANVPAFAYDGAQLGHATALGLGAGYQFNEYIRADVTGEYRASASYAARASYIDPTICGLARCSDAYAGAFRSAVVMANGYGEIGSWFDVTPFVGLGLGVAHTMSAPVSLSAGNGHGVGLSPGAAQTRLAFALMAGASWDLTPRLKVEVGYRYMNLGSGQNGPIACVAAAGACVGQVQQIGLASHDLRIGLRYALRQGSSQD